MTLEVKQVRLIYFSPTGTTQKILESIAGGLSVENVESIDLTLLKGTKQAISPFSDELVIIGAPVYGGRLPVEAINRFKMLKADNTLAIVVVLYGNREFEDSLLELKDLATELGFIPVAGGAFIGEHSFATEDIPIANGRPDSFDLQKAKDFGAKIKAKIAALQSVESQPDLKIPGRFPYQGGALAIVVAPVLKEESCTLCGECVDVCPTEAISINKSVETKTELCIRCSACIKICPTGARYWEDGTMKKIIGWLNENCSTRKEPQVFGVDI
jgi:ferredoxin